MLRIRLTRMGAKKSPFYRVIIKEKRSKRDGKYLENLGTYNPMVDPPEVNLNHDRIDYWISKGAQPTETVASLLKHNPRMTPEEKAEFEKKREEAKAAKVVAVEKERAEARARAEKEAAEKLAAETAEAATAAEEAVAVADKVVEESLETAVEVEAAENVVDEAVEAVEEAVEKQEGATEADAEEKTSE